MKNLYGPTETTVSVTSLTLDEDSYESACADSVALGDPIPGMSLHRIGGANDDEGEIAIAGPQLATGYWWDPDRTAEAFRIAWIDGAAVRCYATGDWGERRGNNLFFKTRIDRQVNGYRIEVDEVVARLADLGWPVACVLKHGDVLVAVIEANTEGTLDPAALRAWLHTELEPYAVPAEIHLVEQLPRNANDKLDETGARERLAGKSP